MTTTENDVDGAKKGIEANPRVALFTSGTKTSSFSKGLHCGDGVSQHGSPPQRENEDDSAKATTTKKDTDKEGNEEIAPLDAFMTNEIDPEIAERERLERERAEREREERANMDEAKRRKMLSALVNDSDDSDDADESEKSEEVQAIAPTAPVIPDLAVGDVNASGQFTFQVSTGRSDIGARVLMLFLGVLMGLGMGAVCQYLGYWDKLIPPK